MTNKGEKEITKDYYYKTLDAFIDPLPRNKELWDIINKRRIVVDKTMEISDRSKAIKAAIEVSDSGDTILVTGMGHEQYRVVDGNKVAWNDATEIRKFL